MSSSPANSQVPAPGLTPEQLRQLAEARQLAVKIRRAASYAYFDFWGVAVFAGLTLAGSMVSFGWAGFLLGVAMAIAAYVEFHGARDLKRLDESAPKRLALNQVFLGASVFLYAMFSLWRGLRNPGALSGMMASQVPPNMALSINNLARLVVAVLYGTLAAVAIFVQGGTALFYRSREAHLRKYLASTPPWILQAQRAGLGI